jgi:hypothetical protein
MIELWRNSFLQTDERVKTGEPGTRIRDEITQ